MAEGKIRLAFVNADHLHFGGLLRAALDVPWAEVVGMVIHDIDEGKEIGLPLKSFLG